MSTRRRRVKYQAYSVVITRGRVGFPRGEWTTVDYRPMALQIAARLRRDDGVGAKVVPVTLARRNPTGAMTDTEKVVLGLAGLAAFVAIIAYSQKSSASTSAPVQGPSSGGAGGTTPASMPPMAGVTDQVPPFVPGFS